MENESRPIVDRPYLLAALYVDGTGLHGDNILLFLEVRGYVCTYFLRFA